MAVFSGIFRRIAVLGLTGAALTGCTASSTDALIATVWPADPPQPTIITDQGFVSSDALGYILFVIEPQARAARINTSLMAEAPKLPAPASTPVVVAR
jgi:hypothetical protein